MDFKAILFDLDGTLIDSMKDNFLAWKKSMENEGVIIKEEDYYPLEGAKVIEIAKIFSKEKDYSFEDFQRIVDFKNKFYRENHIIKFYPKVQEFIDFFKSENILIAIVSASPAEKLFKTVPKSFLDKFDCLISGDCVENGKPHPDPYLSAAKKLGLAPEECIVVENAPLGIKSAKNAKMHCVAIGSTMPKEKLEEADIFIDRFEDLKDCLCRLKSSNRYTYLFNSL